MAKVQGKKRVNPRTEMFFIPEFYEDGEPLILTLGAVLDFDKFNELVKLPETPTVRKPNGETYKDPDDSDYRKSLFEYWLKKNDYIQIQSVLFTEGFEYEFVNINDPDTWSEFDKDLSGLGLTEVQITFLKNMVSDLNGINERRMEEAREAFFAENNQKAAAKA